MDTSQTHAIDCVRSTSIFSGKQSFNRSSGGSFGIMCGRKLSHGGLNMNTLEMYNQRFIGNGQRVFAQALNGARRRGQNYVVVEHFIEALITEEERFFRLLAGLLDIDLGQIQTLMARRLENFPQQASGKLRLAPATIALLKQAWEVARNEIGRASCRERVEMKGVGV